MMRHRSFQSRLALPVGLCLGLLAAVSGGPIGLAGLALAVQPAPTAPLEKAADAAEPLDGLARLGLDTTGLVGIPTLQEAVTIKEAVDAVIHRTSAARAAAQQEVARLRTKGSGLTAAESERLAALQDGELALRLPLLAGRAAAVRMVLLTGEERRTVVAAGIGELERIDGASTAAEALRRVSLAVLLAERNGPATGGAAADRDQADELLRSVLDLPEGTDPSRTAAQATRVEAGLALVMMTDGTPAAIEAAAKLLPERGAAAARRVRVAEAATRARIAAAGRSLKNAANPALPQARQDPADTPLGPLVSLLALGKPSGSSSPADLAVWQKIAGAAELLPRNSDLAASIGRLARSASTTDGLPEPDPADLRAVPEAIAREAAWSWATAVERAAMAAKPPQPEQAVRAFRQVIAIDTQRTRAAEAENQMLAIARVAATDESSRKAVLLPVLDELIAAERDGPRRRALLAERGLLRLGFLSPRLPLQAVQPTLSQVMADLQSLDPASPVGRDASRRISAFLLAWVNGSKPPAWPLAASDFVPWRDVCVAAEAVADHPLLRADAATRERLAYASACAGGLSGDGAALARLREMLARPSEKLDQTQGRIVLARSLVQAGKSDAAAEVLRELIDPYQNTPAESTRPAEFWLAWADLLWIMAERGEKADRVSQMRLRVRALEAIDPGLGGAETADRIAGAMKYAER